MPTDAPSSPPDDIAPRPRPGYRSPVANTAEMAALFAGVLRALVGLVCFFAALLYLPSTPATPILTGVSIVLVITGNLSAFRAVRETPAVKVVARALAVGSTLVVVVCVALTVVMGAGAFRPVPKGDPDDGPPTVRFDSGR